MEDDAPVIYGLEFQVKCVFLIDNIGMYVSLKYYLGIYVYAIRVDTYTNETSNPIYYF